MKKPIPYVEMALDEASNEVFNICNLTASYHISIIAGIQRLLTDFDRELNDLRNMTINDVFHSHDNNLQIIERIHYVESQREYVTNLIKRINYNHVV
jgi:hypothetical protein